MSEVFSLRWAASTLKAVGLGAVLLGALALVVVAWGVVSVAAVLFGPNPKQLESKNVDQEWAAKQASLYDSYLAQINGRTLLVTPAAPSTDDPPAPVDETPKDPPKPTVYGGPAVTAMMLDSAWFADGSRLTAGGEGKGDLKVLSLNPPWDIKVVWRGVEFDVPLFDRNKVVFKEASSGAASTRSPHESAPASAASPVEHIANRDALPVETPKPDAGASDAPPVSPTSPPQAPPATVDPK